MSFGRKTLSATALTLGLLAFTPTVLFAQFISGIEGTVTDQTSAVVPNASVTIENLATGIKATALTTNAGYFRFPALPSVAFRLTAAAAGFKTTQVNELRLEVGEIRTLNVSLEVGLASASVSVEARAAVVEQKQITDLPLQGRNFLGLVAFTPGVTGSTGQTTSSAASRRSA